MLKELAKIKDPLTGEIFTPKKISQKFSCPANRIKFNNLKAREFQRSLEYIIGPLINNYKILDEILKGRHEGSFHVEFLRGKGFDFKVMTHMSNNPGKGNLPCQFKYMIIKEDNDKVKIIQND